MSNTNVQVVKDCYEAFQREDAETLFGAMAPDIEWDHVGRESDFPTFGPRHGLPAVREFFRDVADNLDFHSFEPREFHGIGDLVFVMGSYAVTVRKTGRPTASEWLHVFRLKGGKITRFREFTDTAKFAEAWRD